MTFPLSDVSDARLGAMLAEDVPYGDLTTLGLGIGDATGRATFRARTTMVVACAEEAERLMLLVLLAGCTRADHFAVSGAQVEAGAALLTAAGPALALHRGAKTAQTLLEIAAGVAIRAHRILRRTRGPGRRRRRLHAQASPRRQGRHAEGHHGGRLRAAPPRPVGQRTGLRAAPRLPRADATAPLGRRAPDRAAQAEDRGGGGERALAAMPRRPLVGAAGGVTEGNAAAHARAGADLLVTSAPYAAPPLDVSVTMEPA